MPMVLVVDDMAFVRARCVKVLNEHGFATIEAASGAQAVEAYQAARPDAVLMDVTMPGMDGLDTLSAIMAIDPRARVAMVAALGQQALIMRALRAGARDYVVKPFQAPRVVETAHKLLAA